MVGMAEWQTQRSVSYDPNSIGSWKPLGLGALNHDKSLAGSSPVTPSFLKFDTMKFLLFFIFGVVFIAIFAFKLFVDISHSGSKVEYPSMSMDINQKVTVLE